MGHTGHFCSYRKFRDSWEWKSLETPIQTSHHMCQIFRFSQLWFQPGIIELPRLSTELPLTLIHGTRTSAFSAWSLQDLRVLVNHWNIFGSRTSCSVVHWLHSALWWTLCRDQCNSIMAIYFHYALTYQPASCPTFQATDQGLNRCTGWYTFCHSYIILSRQSWKVFITKLASYGRFLKNVLHVSKSDVLSSMFLTQCSLYML